VVTAALRPHPETGRQMRLSDRVAIVTGAAHGIGLATAQLFVEEGARVLMADIDVAAGEEAARSIGAQQGKARFIEANVGKEAECKHVVDECVRTFGRLDVLVNNAACFVLKGLEATREDWIRIMEVGVFGYSYMTRMAAAEMRKIGGGTVVNVASVSSVVAQPNFVTYNASKGAVLQLTRCAAMDLAPDNIRVNCVCPGLVWTSIVERRAAEARLTREEVARDWAPLQFIKRAAEPREIAYSILFLASDESSFCTGSPLFVDGGHTAQ